MQALLRGAATDSTKPENETGNGRPPGRDGRVVGPGRQHNEFAGVSKANGGNTQAIPTNAQAMRGRELGETREQRGAKAGWRGGARGRGGATAMAMAKRLCSHGGGTGLQRGSAAAAAAGAVAGAGEAASRGEGAGGEAPGSRSWPNSPPATATCVEFRGFEEVFARVLQTMDDSIARSRRRRATGPLGVSQADAVTAPGSYVSDLAFDASFQGGLQGEPGERAGSAGGLWGSGASGAAKESESFDVAVDDAPRAAAGQFMASFSGGSGYGGSNSSLFSGMQLFGSQPPVVMQQQQQQQMASVQQQQQQQQRHQQQQQIQNFSSSLGWQNMTSLVGGQQNLGQAQSQALMHGLGFGSEQGLAPSSSLGHLIPTEENWIGRDGDAIPASEMSLGGDSSDSEDSSKGEAGRLRGRKEKMVKGGSSGDKLWRKLRGSEKGEDKSEGFRESGEPSQTPRPKARKSKHKHSKSRKDSEGLLEDSVNEEFLASSSDSGSSSDYSDRDKKEGWNKKRKRAGQDADGNVTWTDESVKFLFETYDAIHQRLWEESNGHVKYQKKWTPILKAMQDKFGKHFSKKQCQSKYWSVRRECADYRNMSAKAARSDPSWNPSIAGRELLKPKFYDVWFEVSGKKEALQPNTNSTKTLGVKDGGALVRDSKPPGSNASWKVPGKDGQQTKHKVEDCGTALKEMQRLMQVQLQASEKREEAMKFRAELMMDLLTQHMEHVERRVSNLDEGRQPQLYLLERVNNKLEKVLEGFTALNENLSIVAFKFTQKQS